MKLNGAKMLRKLTQSKGSVMNLDKIQVDVLKKMAAALNVATYEAEGVAKLFLGGKKIKTVAVAKEGLAKAFDEAIRSINDEIVNNLPEEIIDFYNEFFSEATEAEITGEAPVATPKPVKEKKEKVVKEKKVKVAKELSCFGHKVGTQSAALDELLAPGNPISLDDLVAKSGRSLLGVKGHIKHLQESRGLKIEVKDNIYQLVK